jgi:hypothetical protein
MAQEEIFGPKPAWLPEHIADQQPECMQKVRHYAAMVPDSPFARNSNIWMKFLETSSEPQTLPVRNQSGCA